MERRDFIKTGAILGAAASMPSFSFASAKGSDRIKVGLIGCGGRGTGAACNMMGADANIEFVAFADLFEDKIQPSIDILVKESQKVAKEKRLPSGSATQIINPTKVQRFSGWDCVDQILSMKEIDLIIHAAPPVFRTPHYKKIVAAGKHAFLEKPACVDITQAREMLALADEANKKGLSVVCGTQRRYHERYVEVIKRVQDGMIGEPISALCYWNDASYIGQEAHDMLEKKGVLKGLTPDDMEYQIRNWFSFIWASGDHIVEQHVHNIDVIMWALGDNRMPVEVRGMGGRSTDLPSKIYGDRFSHFAVDFDMGNGLRLASYCQQDPKTSREIGERIVGTKGILYSHVSYGACKITDHKGKVLYAPKDRYSNELIEEHKFLLSNLRAGKQVNTLKQLVNSTLLAIAGRMSAYSGKKFKFEWMMRKSQESLVPEKMGFYKNPVAGVPVPGKYRLY